MKARILGRPTFRGVGSLRNSKRTFESGAKCGVLAAKRRKIAAQGVTPWVSVGNEPAPKWGERKVSELPRRVGQVSPGLRDLGITHASRLRN